MRTDVLLPWRGVDGRGAPGDMIGRLAVTVTMAVMGGLDSGGGEI